MLCHGTVLEAHVVSWHFSEKKLFRERNVCGKLCAQGSAWLLALHAYLTENFQQGRVPIS
jgi:hypothetical protein